MTFDETLEQSIELLRRRGRISYRALKRQFELDDDYLADLVFELVQGQCLAVDGGGVLFLRGEGRAARPPGGGSPL